MEDVILEGMSRIGKPEGRNITSQEKIFFVGYHEQRTEKHFADINGGAAGKRLNMFLRWMVRKDDRGVDFGMWKQD